MVTYTQIACYSVIWTESNSKYTMCILVCDFCYCLFNSSWIFLNAVAFPFKSSLLALQGHHTLKLGCFWVPCLSLCFYLLCFCCIFKCEQFIFSFVNVFWDLLFVFNFLHVQCFLLFSDIRRHFSFIFHLWGISEDTFQSLWELHGQLKVTRLHGLSSNRNTSLAQSLQRGWCVSRLMTISDDLNSVLLSSCVFVPSHLLSLHIRQLFTACLSDVPSSGILQDNRTKTPSWRRRTQAQGQTASTSPALVYSSYHCSTLSSLCLLKQADNSPKITYQKNLCIKISILSLYVLQF